MIPSSPTSVLTAIPRGVAKCIFAVEVSDALAELELSRDWTPTRRIVTIAWDEPPRIDRAVEEMVEHLARAAQTAWPDWLGMNLSPRWNGSEAADHVARELAGREEPSSPASLIPWLKRAWIACQLGRPPAVAGKHALAAEQLAALLDPPTLTLLLAVRSASKGPEERWDGLGRAAEWLAQRTGARVALLLDQRLVGSPAVGRLDSEPLWWPAGSDRSGSAGSGRAAAAGLPSKGEPQENKLRVWPVVGRPHPESPGELLLCELLEKDSDLAGVFQYNQEVRTVHGSRYLVDLLASVERVIIEIDGYHHHAHRSAFAADRHRDYELHTSGYLVLRIPHWELFEDSEFCLRKVRRMLEFRRRDRSG